MKKFVMFCFGLAIIVGVLFLPFYSKRPDNDASLQTTFNEVENTTIQIYDIEERLFDCFGCA